MIDIDKKVLTSRYDYDLDKNSIAKYPMDRRDNSKLLYVDRRSGNLVDNIFSDIVDLLDSSYMIVVNNSKVMRSRIPARRVTGGKSEIFITDILKDTEAYALLKGKFKDGDKVEILTNDLPSNDLTSNDLQSSDLTSNDLQSSDLPSNNLQSNNLQSNNLPSNNLLKDNLSTDDFAIVKSSLGEGRYHLEFSNTVSSIMERYGKMPLPPYIDRDVDISDDNRYQTVYSKQLGSSAAPTAGLHFTTSLIELLNQKGITVEEITLNVGIGTFRDIKTEYIDDHIMHTESYSISVESANRINMHKRAGGKVLAVGTTVVRTLESSCDDNGDLVSGDSSSNIFIKEGYQFKIVDAMITNFHLPKSTLLALVSAFGGYENIMKAYKYAISNKYRFFSYGDAMLIY